MGHPNGTPGRPRSVAGAPHETDSIKRPQSIVAANRHSFHALGFGSTNSFRLLLHVGRRRLASGNVQLLTRGFQVAFYFLQPSLQLSSFRVLQRDIFHGLNDNGSCGGLVPGRTCGQRCVTSPCASFVTGTGVPPPRPGGLTLRKSFDLIFLVLECKACTQAADLVTYTLAEAVRTSRTMSPSTRLATFSWAAPQIDPCGSIQTR